MQAHYYVYFLYHAFTLQYIKGKTIIVHNNCIMNFTNSGQSLQMYLRLYDRKWN